jgi:sterol-4alpha-carboxylate 3-dehydrogenase (decarboxylating)
MSKIQPQGHQFNPITVAATMAFEGASILITGGCGQVGVAIVEHLLNHHPQAHIVVLDLAKPVPSHARLDDNVTYFTGDVTNKEIVREVLNNVRPLVVFHTAGLIPQIAKRLNMDSENHYRAVNVQGTKQVLEAAEAVGSVKAFVYTSSSDVVKGESWQDLVNVNESMPVPANFDDPYAESKVRTSLLCCSFS